MASLHERVVALERNAIQHDKQIKAIRDLVRVARRLRTESHKDMAELRRNLRELSNRVLF